MREIKFRGKRTDNGEWVEGFLIGLYNPQIKENVIKQSFIHNGTIFYNHDKVIPETVGQFTGLTDKNGKEIYEGDICKVLYSSIGFQIDVMGVVYWGDWSMSYQIYLLPNQDEYKLADYKSDIEVIGNIHDNHELLK